jgi:transcriptional regulator with XRE-family HTH domain
MENNEKKIMENVRILRIRQRISQNKMAEMIGISQTGYSKMERCEVEHIPLFVAVGIAKALRMDFFGLFLGSVTRSGCNFYEDKMQCFAFVEQGAAVCLGCRFDKPFNPIDQSKKPYTKPGYL